MPTRRIIVQSAAAVAALALIATAAVAATGGFGAGDPKPGEPLARESILTPDELGDGSFDGLQYADPTEGLSLVDSPEAANDGGAHLAYPIDLPKGRGLAPELALQYDSGGGNGWTGLGWDLSVGEIAVDTTFGVPYFDPDFESESYTLDGDPLLPNALGDAWQQRAHGDREDFVRQVETEYEQIIRHEVGDGGPDDYFWEVRDKDGGIRWYGGYPDAGGPDGDTLVEDGNAFTIDRSAIVKDGDDNQVRWLLSAQRDVGVNVMRFHYDRREYHWVAGGEWSAGCATGQNCAEHTYLERIDYTAAAQVSGEPEDPAYQVHFLLETDPDVHDPASGPAPKRFDPILDGTGRYLDLVKERLARIEVRYGAPVLNPDYDPDDATKGPSRLERAYTTVAARYDLAYRDGPFGKSLLESVTQGAHATSVAATHTFAYYDEARNGTTYKGLVKDAATPTWNTGDDLGDRQFLDENASASALGGSESNAGEGHAYIGFNPFIPQKLGSFGGSVQIGGGRTDGLVEWIDLNGDGLPDKVYKERGEATNPNVKFRLNQSGPDGGTTFSEPIALDTLDTLSIDSNFDLQLSLEAHLGITASFGIATGVSWGDSYFTDVNADGLPDYVSGGNVLFNRLVADANGKLVPTFEDDGGSGTPVPILAGSKPDVESSQLDDLRAMVAEQSPLVDTVRRWIAPFDGTVSIDGPARLAPAKSSKDGVRVAIQQNGAEVVPAVNLLTTGSTAFTEPIPREVQRGDRLYFRVGSVNNGANDEVEWSPVIHYTHLGTGDDAVAVVESGEAPAGETVTEVPLDANGLSQLAYDATADFTLSGRPDTNVVMPLDGTVRFTASIEKSAATTDDLQLVLQYDGAAVTGSAIVIPADFVGTTPVSVDFAVGAPEQPDPDDPDDHGTTHAVHTHLAVDSPIDLQAISWDPQLHYLDATDSAGDPVEVVNAKGEPIRVVDFAPEVEQYPQRASTAPVEPWTADEDADGSFDAKVEFSGVDSDPLSSRSAILTVKSAAGLVAQRAFTLTPEPVGSQWTAQLADFVDLEEGVDYWYEVSIRDRRLAAAAGDVRVTLTENVDPGQTAHTFDVTPEVYSSGQQGIFPLPYRGWGVAAYTANGGLATKSIEEDAFTIDVAAHQAVQPADGFDDVRNADTTPDPSFAYLPVANPPTLDPKLDGQLDRLPGAQWRGNRDNLAANADRMRSSRLGSDDASIAAPEGGDAADAPARISISGPSLAVGFGFGPLGGSVGVGPSFGIVDFEDLNGDGYPDVIKPSSAQYTTQRGALGTAESTDLLVTNQDLTVSAQGGLSAGLADISPPNSKGGTNAVTGGAAGKGGTATDDAGLDPGFGISLGGGIDAEWTSPNASAGALLPNDPFLSNTPSDPNDSDFGGNLAGIPADGDPATAPIQQELADVNGDGLPDRVYTNPSGVFVEYGLGYDFAKPAVQLATGGFGTQESIGGNASAGFSTPWGEFSGGVSFAWNYDTARFAWVDVNGDGILDRLHKRSTSDQPTVSFGTGTGLLDPVSYGDFAHSAGVGAADLAGGPQIGYDRSQGIGGGFDFTVYVGPLCAVACYLVINPGASYSNSVSFSEVTLEDIDGDGYIDSLASTDDDSVEVHRNTHGRTNLLESVANPLGGSIAIEYEREGNTIDHADSIWTMTRVAVDDGRPGDGVDVLASTFEYDGLAFDRLFRQSLGFASMVEHGVEAATDAKLRTTTHTYLNDSIFTTGLETSTVISDHATGRTLRTATTDWKLREVLPYDPGASAADEVEPLDPSLLDGLDTPASLVRSFAPLAVAAEEEWFDDAGIARQETRSTFTYDGLGNVLAQLDEGETDDPDDDVRTEIVYSDCDISSTMDPVCPEEPDHPSPFWFAQRCPTWVSIPAVVTVTNGETGAGELVYSHRDGRTALCDNDSVTHLEETVDDDTIAVTDLAYDEWGSYAYIVYPEGEEGVRYAVQYTYDSDRHSDIAEVTEFDLDDTPPTFVVQVGTTCPLVGTSVEAFLDYEDCTVPVPVRTGLTSTATFDPLAGRVASRTDANGNTTSYGYDPLGRIASIGNALVDDVVTYEYQPSAADYGYAIARHADRFNSDLTDADPSNDDPIETVAFVDGMGRVTQEKRDARVVDATGAAVDGRIASGATNFDVLGRAIQQYRPVFDTVAQTAYEYTTSAPETVTTTTYNLLDQELVVAEPGDRTNTTAYGFDDVGDAGPRLFTAATTDPRGRVYTTYTDVRGNVHAQDDAPAGLDPLTSTYDYDGVGRLLQVTDVAGNETTHTYDQAGNRTSTDTPDGGLVEFWFDAEGKLIADQSPTLREESVTTAYSYELRKLTHVDYPQDTPDVTYTYGESDAPHNGAGRVVQMDDASQILSLEYDALGAVSRETAEMKLHNWSPDTSEPEKFRWTTEWEYDALGRLASMVYPDGERLAYDYDVGGLVTSVAGEEDGTIEVPVLDAAGNPVLDADGNPVTTTQDVTWSYPYVDDRRYDELLRPAAVDLGNGVTTEWTYDPLTEWLAGIHSDSTVRPLKGNPAAYTEIQDQRYGYDKVGNVRTYDNDLPPVVSNLFSGPTNVTYTYDGYDRLKTSDATHAQWTGTRSYSFVLDYDDDGNVRLKQQVDKLGKKVQPETTYSFDRTYAESGPHQVATQGQDSFHYDADGELVQITRTTRKKTEIVREMEWNWAGRMVLLDEYGETTQYTYDDDGALAIERGPGGETAFINPWVTVRNGNEMYKHVWAGDERIATQRDDGDAEETKRYFLHKDLQGSTNTVTDAAGQTFQHQEYFPTGEVWVDEHSTVFRTPYQFGGGYTDEQRDLISFGDRWYDPRRELFLTTDPVLYEDPAAIIGSPELRSAYAYAASNPLRYGDPSGQVFTIQKANDVVAAARAYRATLANASPAMRGAALGASASYLPKSFVRLGQDHDRSKKLYDFAQSIDPNPIFEIDLAAGTVKIGAPYGPRAKLGGSKKSSADAPQSDPAGNDPNATAVGGGPAATTGQSPAAGSAGAVAPSAPSAGQSPDQAGGKTTKQAPKPLPKRPAQSTTGGTDTGSVPRTSQ